MTNTFNSFGTSGVGVNQLIAVTGGQLAFTGSSGVDSLGNVGNVVENTNNNGGINNGFRFFNGVTTPSNVPAAISLIDSRNFFLNAGTTNFDVAPNASLTLSTGLSVVAAGDGISKNDDGTLVLSHAFNNVNTPIGTLIPATTWTGGMQINAGAVELTANSAFGTGTIGVVLEQAALQLAGGVTVANAISLNTTGTGGYNILGGINSRGGVENVSGNNTITGAITLNQDNLIGADAGTLTISTGINVNGHQIGFTAAAGAAIDLTAPFTGNVYGFQKLGAGTLNITASNTVATTNVGPTIYAGTVDVSGNNVYFELGSNSTRPLTINQSGVFTLDDSQGTATANRLGNSTLTMNGGTFNYIVNTSGSSESNAALTINPGGAIININDGTSGVSTLTFTTLTQNAGGSLEFTGAYGTANNKIVFSTAPTLTGGATPATNGLLARDVVINGSGVANFATYNTNGVATNALGIQAFTGYDNNGAYTNINSAAATDTVAIGAGYVTNSAITSATTTLNALAMSGGTTLSGPAGYGALTLTSGGVLFNGIGNTITEPIIAQGATEYIYHVAASSSGIINSAITGTSGLTKADAGSLQLANPTYYSGTTTINGGTLQLASGATNTLFHNNSLVVNNGGTLDLNGGVQYVGNLSSSNATVATTTPGGTITSTNGPATLVANTGATVFAGSITNTPGNDVTFIRSGTANTFYLLGPNSYTGPTLIEGGGTFFSSGLSGTVLADNGSLSATSSVTINYSSLTLNNSSVTLTDSSSRINPSAPITLNGGSFDFLGRTASASNESFGALTVNSGLSIVSSTNQSNIGGGTDTATISFTNLVLNTAAGSTVEFAQNYQNNSNGNLGLQSDAVGHSENILFSQINGVSTATVGGGLTNNIISGSAIVAGNGTGTNNAYFNYGTAEFASYIPGLGIGGLNTAGFAGYDNGATGTLPTSLASTQNLRLTASTTLPSGGASLNSLNLVNTAASTAIGLSFTSANDTLNLTSGGLIVQNVVNGTSGVASLGSATVPGQITSSFSNGAGANDLYLYYFNTTAANVLSDYSAIVDNGTTPVRLVAYGGDFGAGNITLLGTNTYTGGTLVNGETLTIGATGVLGSGGVTLNGGSLVEVAGGSLGSSPQSITLNGPSTLTLAANNVISSLIFNNNGGSTAPNVSTTGGVLNIATGAITASSSNVGTTAVITAGTVDLNNVASPTITVNPISYNGSNLAPLQPTLNIAAVLQDASNPVTVTGGGVLELSAANTFTGGVSLATGTGLMFNANTATVGSNISTGPVGTGTLSLANNTSLLTGGTITVANNIALPSGTSTVNFASTGATTNSLTLGGYALGNIQLQSSAVTTLNVVTPQMTTTLAGVVTGGGELVKSGLGTLALTNNNSFTGGVVLQQGTLLAEGLQGANGSPLSGSAAIPFGLTSGGAPGTLTYQGGLLDLHNNGTASNSQIQYAANVNVVNRASLSAVMIDVNDYNGTNTGNTIVLNSLNFTGATTTAPVVDVTGGNSYSLRINSANLGSVTSPVNFNVAAGLTVYLPSNFNSTNAIDTGAGKLVYTGSTVNTAVAVSGTQQIQPFAASTANQFGTSGAIQLASGATLQVLPGFSASDPLTGAGYTAGGLKGQYFNNVGNAYAPVSTNMSSLVPAATIPGQYIGDASDAVHANLVANVANYTDSNAVYTGLLNVTTAGIYTFTAATDDSLKLSVDGSVVSNILMASTAGTGIAQSQPTQIYLTVGEHFIDLQTANFGGNGGAYVLYGGPDTTSSNSGLTTTGGSSPPLVPLSLSSLSYNIGPATAANLYDNAAVVGNALTFSATGTTATVDGLGSDLNSAFASLTLGTNNSLVTNNTGGVGFIGVIGSTTVSGTGASVAPNTGTLYLIGGVSDGGNGLKMTGTGTLILGPSGTGVSNTFTGAFAVNSGFVQLDGAQNSGLTNYFTSGTTTVASGAEIDLNGTTNVGGGALNITGTGNTTTGRLTNTAGTTGVVYNSSAAAASMSDAITFSGNSSIGGYGNITLSGAISTNGNTFTKVGPDMLTLSGTINSLTGTNTVAAGILRAGSTNPLGSTGTLSVTAGAAIDLNGLAVTSTMPLTINGTGVSNTTGVSTAGGYGNYASTLGALINSSATNAASYAGSVALGSGSGVGNSSYAAAPALSYNAISGIQPLAGDMTLSGTVTGANPDQGRHGHAFPDQQFQLAQQCVYSERRRGIARNRRRERDRHEQHRESGRHACLGQHRPECQQSPRRPRALAGRKPHDLRQQLQRHLGSGHPRRQQYLDRQQFGHGERHGRCDHHVERQRERTADVASGHHQHLDF